MSQPKDSSPAPQVDSTVQVSSFHTDAPATFGSFRLIQRLGAGGMGEVWLAEQTEPVHRKVALKVIKPGMDSSQVIGRFEAERQALALMTHPAIAAVFDGGTTSEGRPYFAMEYVKGEPITTYCDRHRLSMEDRLTLFLDVCEGVHHAHQKGVIHRDLKPSNVLVTIVDDRPIPKIIDFGVAKAISQPLTERTVFTELGMLVGTPEYMSPEQAEMGALDIDIRTDVYALGVMLYELLTGALPFDQQALRQAGLDGVRRLIREKEPPKPSTRVTQLGPASSEAAHNRHTEPGRLAKELRGDLDWIVMKTLEKDRTRRYGSASDLVADLQRHLAHQPVLAGPPSVTYRSRKFVQRHRTGALLAATAAIAVVALGILLAVQAARVRAERDVAARARDRAERVSAFLVNLFQASDPYASKGDTVTARELLDRGRQRLEVELKDQPQTRAALLHTIGQVYIMLGRYDSAQLVLEEALSARRSLTGRERTDLADTLNELGNIAGHRIDVESARKYFQESLEIRQAVLGPEHLEIAHSLANLAGNAWYRGDFPGAERQWRAAAAMARRVGAPEEASGIEANLALAAYTQGRLLEAIKILQESIEVLQRTRGLENPRTLRAMNNLSKFLTEAGRFDEAEKMQRQLLETLRKTVGPQHFDFGLALYNLGNTVGELGRYDEAARLLRESLTIFQADPRGPQSQTAWSLTDLGTVENERGNDREAERLHREAEAMFAGGPPEFVAKTWYGLGEVFQRRGNLAEAEKYFRMDYDFYAKATRADSGAALARPETALGRVLTERGRADEAEPLLRHALDGVRKKLPPDHWRIGDAEVALGACLTGRRQFDEAQTLLLHGYATLHATRGDDRDETRHAVRSLVKLFDEWGKPDKAAEWRAKAGHLRASHDPG